MVGDIANIDAYTAALAGAQTADEACERLSAAGCVAATQGESVVIGDGEATASPFEGVNKIGDAFFLWCLHDRDGEIVRCVARGPQGSCPPRH
ncbi:hypothetical protein MSEN_09630 [Mycolicibacter senuensis]|uniref:Uncharacterized protein n=1 Tax=Mycolicibacter senuensis TaxID=386913 RepID=A0A7I9XGZ5_9MYCO|nr:hypothetical protein [Actinomycetota bacterium]GFG69243.1 hypothetical protein MSEN_09630 [Mycolicibacter senuensis]